MKLLQKNIKKENVAEMGDDGFEIVKRRQFQGRDIKVRISLSERPKGCDCL